MCQRHLHMFHVGHMFVQGSLVLDVLSPWLRLPVYSWSNMAQY